MNFLKQGKKILTKNLAPGKTVYDESLVNINNNEFRTWDPRRSKLGAAIVKGVRDFKIKEKDTVLYLGAASGTTSSHVSDIVGKRGFVFALDFAPRVVRNLVYVCEDRKNMAPLLADASQPNTYSQLMTEVDVVFQDIAQPNQTEIFLNNIDLFLKKGGFGLLAVKARCIDVSKKPKIIFDQVKKQLEKEVKILQQVSLEPFERDHAFFVVEKR
jgi:fibrillarin-like pre-rRNA processing protein